ncbi:MAG: hypothetical protein KIT77_26740 [Caldilinea sp.]|nr:hypothetical protein [Caldilinea sp.]
MDTELQYLIRFFNDRAFLFKTITMAAPAERDAVCDAICARRGWYGGRFAASERQAYLRKRLFVERALYADYTQTYGPLKETAPVYFYLYPNITAQRALDLAIERTHHNEVEAQVLMVPIQEFAEAENVTFTLNDSHTAYRERVIAAGVERRGDGPGQVVLPDHNRVFPFSMIEALHRRYRAQAIPYEVQVWDYQLLDRLQGAIVASDL